MADLTPASSSTDADLPTGSKLGSPKSVLPPVNEDESKDSLSPEKAEEFKANGNAHFKHARFEEAVKCYSEAITANPTVAAYYANRAFCHIKVENYGLAVTDATKAIEVNKSYSKGYYRRGTAYFALGRYKQALADFKKVSQMSPKDPDAARKLKECQKRVMQQAFAKAIESDNSKPPSEMIKLETIMLPSDYDGPRLPEPMVMSQEFIEAMIEHFRVGKQLPKRYIVWMLFQIIDQLKALPSLVDVPVPASTKITVFGDIHGQFYDLLNIFKLNGLPSSTNPCLFNGDFVDRGSWSLEVIMTLFAFKILYPQHVHLARGNHESRTMNQIYGFQGEVQKKVDGPTFELFLEAFNWLPLGHVLGNKVFVVHGGLFSRDDVTLDEIRKVDRNQQPPESGIMCEMLWSDPQPAMGRAPSKRGVGLGFGPDITSQFLQRNNLEMVVRSHEVKAEGYEVMHDGKLVTIFSAPNYCDQMGNKGAFITFDDSLKPKYTTFDAVSHPPIRPMAYATSNFQL